MTNHEAYEENEKVEVAWFRAGRSLRREPFLGGYGVLWILAMGTRVFAVVGSPRRRVFFEGVVSLLGTVVRVSEWLGASLRRRLWARRPME